MRERTCVYRLYDVGDRLLYIGITTDPQIRWQAHSGRSWWPEVARKEVRWFDKRAEAEAVETAAIKAERPLHNRAHADYHPPLGTSVRELRSNFADVINDAAVHGKVTFITSRGRRIAALVPVGVAEAAVEAYPNADRTSDRTDT